MAELMCCQSIKERANCAMSKQKYDKSNPQFLLKKIITDLAPLDYEKTYASSIMFPFANRINNGKYTFMGGEFQLYCNEKESNNALHGLIYNKKFDLIKTLINLV